jgi:uncharacterized protein
LRASSHNIYVPLLGSDRYLLMHGYSGALDIVDHSIAAFLQNSQTPFSRRDSPLPDDIMARLVARGYITEGTEHAERDRLWGIARVLNAYERRHVGFAVVPTYNCNLRCSYCFERPLQERPKSWLGATMEREQVDAAFTAMNELGKQARKTKPIVLYGGEPLLGANYDIVEYILQVGASMNHTFHAVTNGVQIGRYESLLGPGKIERLQITLDGPPEIHDLRRKTAGGKGTFADIAGNISLALRAGARVAVRVTVDADNLDHLGRLAEIIVRNGWPQSDLFSAYCAPVTSNGNPSLSTEIAEMLLEEPEIGSVMRYHLENYVFRVTGSAVALRISTTACATHRGYYIFDPFGQIYTCVETVGVEGAGHLGEYCPRLALDESRVSAWLERNVLQMPEVMDCRYGLICGGGCANRALASQGTLAGRACDCQEFGQLVRLAANLMVRRYESSQAPVTLEAPCS